MHYEEFKAGYNSWCLNWQRRALEEHAKLLFEKFSHIPGEEWELVVTEALGGLDKFPRIKDIAVIHESVKGRVRSKPLRQIGYEPDATPEQIRFSNKCREYMNMWCEGKIDTLPSVEEIKEEIEGVPF